MARIRNLRSVEILDSRGRPTLQTKCVLEGGTVGTAQTPSGASRGKSEALELRDGDPKRFRGLGCRLAVAHVNEEISPALAGTRFDTQEELDRALVDLDGTPNKSRLGANAILSCSLAFARAISADREIELYEVFAEMIGDEARRLPRPTVNLLSGGWHAGKQVPIQDVLMVPVSPETMTENMALLFDVFYAAADLIRNEYGARLLTADEGGLAPDFASAEEMLDLAVASIKAAGYRPGEDCALALDVASSHFYDGEMYQLEDPPLDSASMIERIVSWVEHYPIVSVEDALGEEDWDNWPVLHRRVGGRSLVLGDDFLCTNPRRIQRAIDVEACDALLLKVNQIGTLSEALEACKLARTGGWDVTISARSGETEDNWLGDLSVGWNGEQIKVGSVNQSDRLAKYNRLLVIEDETGFPVNEWPRNAESGTVAPGKHA